MISIVTAAWGMLSGPLKEWGISAAAIQLYGMKLVEAEREGRVILLYHTIAAPYEMMVTDVTNAQYARLPRRGVCHGRGQG